MIWGAKHSSTFVQLGEGLTARWSAIALAALTGAALVWLIAPWIDRLLTALFRLFNAGFRFGTGVYGVIVGGFLRVSILILLGYVGLLYYTSHEFNAMPKGFIPSQDMGYLLIDVQLDNATAAERTRALMDEVEGIAKATPGVKYTQTMAGQSLLLGANGSNFGTMFCMLAPFADRRGPGLDGNSIQQIMRAKFETMLPEATITVLGPPPVRGVGRAGGFKFMIEDRGSVGPQTLQEQADLLLNAARANTRLVGMASVFRANVPSLFVDIDRTAALIRRVPTRDLFDTLRIYFGSLYVNDLNLFGRTWQVIVQANPEFRSKISNVGRLRVRNVDGNMVPLGTMAEVKHVNAPMVLMRYNTYPAAPVTGSAAPGISTGEAINTINSLAERELHPAMNPEWTELAFLELQAGNTAMAVFGVAILMVFLVLAAQYESWSLPLAIILVVPMCLLSAIIGLQYAERVGKLIGVPLAAQDINIFTQIGFVVLVGLASKNAILIVEFAKQRRDEGATARQAALDACKLRLRPIIMTSLAFILGVVPLVLSRGAGAEMRRTLGITVFSGMLGVTIFGIFLTPVFFYVIDRVGGSRIFHSPALIGVNNFILRLLSLRALRDRAEHYVRQRLASSPRKPPSVPEIETAENGDPVDHKRV